MPSDDAIIIEPLKKDAGKSSILPQGIAPIGQTLKHYSTWLWGLLLAAPDGLYVAATHYGFLADEGMPESVKWFIRVVAGVGFVAKFISQKKT